LPKLLSLILATRVGKPRDVRSNVVLYPRLILQQPATLRAEVPNYTSFRARSQSLLELLEETTLPAPILTQYDVL